MAYRNFEFYEIWDILCFSRCLQFSFAFNDRGVYTIIPSFIKDSIYNKNTLIKSIYYVKHVDSTGRIFEQLLTVNTFIDNCDLKVPKLPLLT